MSKNKNEVPILKVENLCKHFKIKSTKLFQKKKLLRAVEDVSFELYEGETLGIVGESGSGKSTLARAILALTEVTSGTVSYNGENITNFKTASNRKLRSELQMIFQDPYASLNPKIKIGDAIAEPMLANKIVSDSKEARKRVEELLVLVGLRPEVYERFPHEFSGGQRQRIGIARALAVNPKIVFCDEAVSALDVSVQAQILNLFNELREKLKLTYVFIGHDLAVVRYISDRILVMYLGKVMEIATYDSLFGDNVHPYTKSLLSAVLEPGTEQNAERIILEGDIPSAMNPPMGCRFSPRCFMAKDICSEKEPELRKVGCDHYIRCHFAKEGVINE